MNPALGDLPGLLAAYLPVFARVFAAMLLMPGFGETAVPAIARIGLSAAIALALSPTLAPVERRISEDDMAMAATIVCELMTGLWFGWLTRLIALALPAAGQYVGYLIGFSNVLQSDVDSAAQSDVLGALFGLAAPMICLATGLYTLPLRALSGLFTLVPVGHILPLADSTSVGVSAVETLFQLSLQLAAPFLVLSIIWNVLIGEMARLGGRMQIYFISFPGQILLGLLVLIISVGSIFHAWEHEAGNLLGRLPGLG